MADFRNLILSATLAACAVGTALPAQARDTKLLLPIDDAINQVDAKEKLSGDIKFYFADQPHPKVLEKMGNDVTNQKTNSFGKSDEKACNWVFLSGLLALQKKAESVGANAVINVVSYYKKNEMASRTTFECHAGGIIAGAALKGDYVKLAK